MFPKATRVRSESWAQVKDNPGYEISDLGSIRSLDRLDTRGRRRLGRLLQPYLTGKDDGYKTVSLYGKNLKIHRLVAQAFLPLDAARGHVNHKDGNKHDNSIENLEWCTASENVQHSFKQLGRVCVGGHPGKRGDLHHASKPVLCTSIATGATLRFGSTRLAADELGLLRESISRAASGFYRHTGGWTFQWERPSEVVP